MLVGAIGLFLQYLKWPLGRNRRAAILPVWKPAATIHQHYTYIYIADAECVCRATASCSAGPGASALRITSENPPDCAAAAAKSSHTPLQIHSVPATAPVRQVQTRLSFLITEAGDAAEETACRLQSPRSPNTPRRRRLLKAAWGGAPHRKSSLSDEPTTWATAAPSAGSLCSSQ